MQRSPLGGFWRRSRPACARSPIPLAFAQEFRCSRRTGRRRARLDSAVPSPTYPALQNALGDFFDLVPSLARADRNSSRGEDRFIRLARIELRDLKRDRAIVRASNFIRRFRTQAWAKRQRARMLSSGGGRRDPARAGSPQCFSALASRPQVAAAFCLRSFVGAVPLRRLDRLEVDDVVDAAGDQARDQGLDPVQSFFVQNLPSVAQFPQRLFRSAGRRLLFRRAINICLCAVRNGARRVRTFHCTATAYWIPAWRIAAQAE